MHLPGFFVRSFVALIPIISLVPLILSRSCSNLCLFGPGFSLVCSWVLSHYMLNLYSVFIDHGSADCCRYFLLPLRRLVLLALGHSWVSFLFFEGFVLTFPLFLVILPNARFFKGGFSPSVFVSLKSEINSLAVLFPLIYLSALSFMGTRHYHYLIPLVPFFALNIARIDLSSRYRQFKVWGLFCWLLGFLYLLGACLNLSIATRRCDRGFGLFCLCRSACLLYIVLLCF